MTWKLGVVLIVRRLVVGYRKVLIIGKSRTMTDGM